MKKVMLIIRDGWGHGPHYEGNAIELANTPNHDKYKNKYPTATIKCTGNDVGNPEGIQGGSEVGHLTIGAGRVVWQPFELINRTIKDKTFFKNKELLAAIQNCKKHNSNLHINGLFSGEGIHSCDKHMYALLELCKQENFNDVYLHLTLDGRDVPEKSALSILKETNKVIKKLGIGKIISLAGRYYTMDRDRNWDRIQKSYDMMVNGDCFKANSPEEAIKQAYERGDKTDYYVQPTLIEGSPLLKDNDSFIWYNYRSDRSRQITAILNGLDYCPKLPKNIPKLHYVCFSGYDSNWTLPVAFPQEKIKNNLSAVLSKHNKTQLRIAETEKYAHVTFFFNSQEDNPYKGESRILVHSPKVPSYDMQPEMSAYEVTQKILPEIGKHDFILLNYANPDLVGHSGVLKAVIKACEVVDECVGKVIEKAKDEYTILLMGDHGNADHMIYDNGEIDPSHGLNPVLLICIDNEINKLNNGSHKDISPTILDLMKIKKPKEMTGSSLIDS